MSNVVRLEDVLKPLGDKYEHLQSSKRTAKEKGLKPEELKNIKREAAKKIVTNELNKWQGIVMANKNYLGYIGGEKEGFKANELNIEAGFDNEDNIGKITEELLKKSDQGRKEDAGLEIQTREEIERELIERKKLRAYMSYKSTKHQKMNKIKSKKYRQLRRKERERTKEEMETDEDEFKDRYKKEVERAKSRAMLKRQGKQEKYVNMMDTTSAEREMIIENIQREQELQSAMGVKNKEYESEELEELCKTDSTLKKREGIFEMKFMKKTLESDVSDEDEDLTDGGMDALPLGSENNNIAKKGDEEEILLEKEETYLTIDEDGLKMDRELVEKVFEDDDIVKEFAREKDEVVEEDAPKTIDVTVPGWGRWGGEGVKESKKRFYSHKEGIKAEERRDYKLKHVIINETSKEHLKKYIVKDLPYPFESTGEYEETIKPSIGRQWTMVSTHRMNVRPKVTIEAGKVIRPLRPEDKYK